MILSLRELHGGQQRRQQGFCRAEIGTHSQPPQVLLCDVGAYPAQPSILAYNDPHTTAGSRTVFQKRYSVANRWHTWQPAILMYRITRKPAIAIHTTAFATHTLPPAPHLLPEKVLGGQGCHHQPALLQYDNTTHDTQDAHYCQRHTFFQKRYLVARGATTSLPMSSARSSG